ncbi:uncharacterized protein IL334_003620 [Kwoniella shivajii]|uniref:Phospholipase A-2-activating protein n=1 Tax=Kwoniella shivajii TaxID=564305 RepID=A0ABZ1CYD4_9TREE|nr:hypothetical protein IL334_003620 [Kwoniella shivajii]
MAPPPYQLAFTLHGHAADVRNLCAPSPGLPLLLSASRDGSAIVWGPSSRSKEWDVKLRVEGPEKRFVSCVGMTRWNGQAFLLLGSQSGILASYVLPSPDAPPPPDTGSLEDPFHTLVEHRQNLCCLDTSKNGLIATGSWDKTVIVWKDFKKVLTIEGHEQAIWAVKFVGEDRLLTASADKKIILHSLDVASGRSTPLQTYTGHTEPVRGLSLKPDGKGFWSCANDGNVNIYSFDKPAPKKTLSGHTSFVYSISAFADGSGAISTGEDGTLRVWSEKELVQTIPHTSNSLWSSAIVPSGSSSPYIASSSSDSTIRFFTRDETLVASAEDRAAWDKEVSGRQLDKSQIGDVKQSDLPGIEALGREGKKDGQVLMIKNNGVVEAYQWSGPTSTWQQIGQVVDAIGQGRKQLYEGQEYDYVFDVDVAEGVPPLKLPYNASENPWIAAQRFLDKNELPSTYCEQVVEFIQKNTNGVTLGQGNGGGNDFVDPFTGGSRYTGSTSAIAGPSYGGGDPFTGGGAYSSTPAPAQPKRSNGILPVKTYLSFKQMNITAAKSKIAQLNEEIKSSHPELAFTDEEEKTLNEIYALLSSPTIALPDVNSKDAKERYEPQVLLNLLGKWWEDKRFPLIDLARCLAPISPAFGATSLAPQAFIESCGLNTPWSPGKARETNTLLSLRGIANLFSTANGRSTIAQTGTVDSILSVLKDVQWSNWGTRKVVVSTIALNYSILAVDGTFPSDKAESLLNLIIHILENEKEDPETVYRASVALGNLIVSPLSGGLKVGGISKGKQLIKDIASSKGEKRLKDLSSEAEELGV